MKYYFIIDHPQQLASAIGYRLKYHLPKKDSILIISNHLYWENVNKSIIPQYFSDHLFLPRPDYSILFFIQIYRLFIAKYRFQNRYTVKPSDIFLCFSTCQFIENLLISTYPHTRSILIHSAATHHHSVRKPSSHMVEKLDSLLANYFIFPLFNMYPTSYVIDKKDQFLGIKTRSRDGNSQLRYRKELTSIYDEIYVLKNKGEKLKTHRLYHEIYYPFGSFSSKKQVKQLVIYLGQPFLNFQNTSTDTYLSLTNRCLRYLEIKYPNKTKIYRPHPRETTEVKRLSLGKFKLVSDKETFELYLMEHARQIAAVYGVSSTGIRSAYNFGLPAFAFFPIFPFPKDVIANSYNILGSLPRQSFITEL